MKISRFSSMPHTALLAAAASLVGTGGLRAQFGSYGLEQRCQFGASSTPTLSLDTPTASIANNTNYIVEVANSQILIKQYPNVWMGMNHLSGTGYGTGIATFYGALGANRVVDNKVLCDTATGRFCLTGMQQDSALVGPAPNGQGLYFALSDSTSPSANPNATGGNGWHVWKTPVPAVSAPGTYQPDFNGMGQNDTYWVYSGIMQPLTFPAGPAFTFVRCVRKSDLAGLVGTPQTRDFVSTTAVATSDFLHAADNYDAGSPIYLAAVLVGSNQLSLVSPNPVTLTQQQINLSVPPFVPASGAAPQPGGFLDTIDGRMQSVVVRDGFMYCCHTILDFTGGPGRHVVRWYQIALNGWPAAGTPTIVQSGNIDLGGQVHSFMPSLAVNSNGTMAITFTSSSSTQNPRVEWRGRYSTDLANTTPRGATLFNSLFPYTTSGGTGGTPNADRWGDWTSIVPRFGTVADSFIVCSPVGLYGAPQLWPSGVVWPPNHWGTRIEPFSLPSSQWVTFYPDALGLGGGGLAGTNGIPLISGYPRARIGQTTNVTVTNSAPAATLGVGLISLGAGTGASSPFGPVWVDLNQYVSTTFSLGSASGSFPLVFPASAAYINAQFFLQGAVLDAGSTTGFGVTQGMQLSVGS